MRNRPEIGFVLGLAMLSSACGEKAVGQTVAVVNGEEITLGELNAALSNANAPATGDKQAIRAQVLQEIVNRRLLAQQAREQGVDKLPEFVTRQRQLTEQLLIGLNAQRQSNTSRLPDQRAIDAFIAANSNIFKNREIWTVQQIQFAAPNTPKGVERLKGARTMEQLIAILEAERIPFQRGETRLDSAALPQAVVDQINKLPASEPFVVPQGGQMVANLITGRQTAPIAPEQSRQVALQSLRKKEADKKLQDSLKGLRASAKIEYQDGYAPKAS
jgi:EpsD family peptidyl-prolyl cis-trans isomerase